MITLHKIMASRGEITLLKWCHTSGSHRYWQGWVLQSRTWGCGWFSGWQWLLLTTSMVLLAILIQETTVLLSPVKTWIYIAKIKWKHTLHPGVQTGSDWQERERNTFPLFFKCLCVQNSVQSFSPDPKFQNNLQKYSFSFSQRLITGSTKQKSLCSLDAGGRKTN